MNINIHFAFELVQTYTFFSVGSPADKLQEVYKPVLTDTECLTNIGGAYDPLHMMCAGYLEGGKGACQVRIIILIKQGI